MIKKDAIKDLCTLSSLSISSVQRVCDKIEDIICHDIKEDFLDMENTSCIDIGIGTLNILRVEDSVSYKFVPSYSLENKIIRTLTTNEDILLSKVEKSLTDKIINNYKDLF